MRFLLAAAQQPRRLGRRWVDRLISVLPRELGFLDPESARALLTAPVPDFPDIYPPGGVERILEKTHRHPYLLQLVGDHLTQRLNLAGRLVATDADVAAAFDKAVNAADRILFLNLWETRSEAERRVLSLLARGGEPAEADGAAVAALTAEGHLVDAGGGPTVAVPLFAEWIADRAG